MNNPPDWRPPIGTEIRLEPPHPWSGNYAKVTRHESWLGYPSMAAELIRDDAMNGHQVGITRKTDFTVRRAAR